MPRVVFLVAEIGQPEGKPYKSEKTRIFNPLYTYSFGIFFYFCRYVITSDKNCRTVWLECIEKANLLGLEENHIRNRKICECNFDRNCIDFTEYLQGNYDLRMPDSLFSRGDSIRNAMDMQAH